MSNRLEMVSASAAAHDVSQAANLVYWLSSESVANRDTAAFHERDLRTKFEELASILGYTVSPITGTPATCGCADIGHCDGSCSNRRQVEREISDNLNQPRLLRGYCQQLLDIIDNCDIRTDATDEDLELVEEIRATITPSENVEPEVGASV